jgi:CDP-6-deoxy-D-xylo-4-hexulose-3-dehydrase
MNKTPQQLRAEILDLVREYHQAAFPPKPFDENSTPIPCAGRVFDGDDIVHLVDSSLDFWLTTGRYAAQFEREFAQAWGIRHALLVNSGSSANLVALSCLTSPKLGDRQLRPGDEVITVAAGFPTTVNPIIQNRLVPVFLDVDVPTYNVNAAQLDAALSPKTRAIMIAHTLGNPYDLERVTAFAKKHVSGQAGRHLRRFGDVQFLSRSSHHDGRGWLCVDRSAELEDAGRVVPRLGPRLLVRPRQGQYLRQTLLLEAGPVAGRL